REPGLVDQPLGTDTILRGPGCLLQSHGLGRVLIDLGPVILVLYYQDVSASPHAPTSLAPPAPVASALATSSRSRGILTANSVPRPTSLRTVISPLARRTK